MYHRCLWASDCSLNCLTAGLVQTLNLWLIDPTNHNQAFPTCSHNTPVWLPDIPSKKPAYLGWHSDRILSILQANHSFNKKVILMIASQIPKGTSQHCGLMTYRSVWSVHIFSITMFFFNSFRWHIMWNTSSLPCNSFVSVYPPISLDKRKIISNKNWPVRIPVILTCLNSVLFFLQVFLNIVLDTPLCKSRSKFMLM